MGYQACVNAMQQLMQPIQCPLGRSFGVPQVNNLLYAAQVPGMLAPQLPLGSSGHSLQALIYYNILYHTIKYYNLL